MYGSVGIRVEVVYMSIIYESHPGHIVMHIIWHIKQSTSYNIYLMQLALHTVCTISAWSCSGPITVSLQPLQ